MDCEAGEGAGAGRWAVCEQSASGAKGAARVRAGLQEEWVQITERGCRARSVGWGGKAQENHSVRSEPEVCAHYKRGVCGVCTLHVVHALYACGVR